MAQTAVTAVVAIAVTSTTAVTIVITAVMIAVVITIMVDRINAGSRGDLTVTTGTAITHITATRPIAGNSGIGAAPAAIASR